MTAARGFESGSQGIHFGGTKLIVATLGALDARCCSVCWSWISLGRVDFPIL